jgi:ABC-type lipoprotein release transport system permease subunit
LILKNAVINSAYLQQKDDGVLVSDRLSKYLKVNVGDSLVLMGQGYQGVSAAGVFPIRGIIKVPAPDLDNKLVYMTIDKAGEFLGLKGQITSIAINLKNTDKMLATEAELSNLLSDKNVTVKNWETLIPTLKQQIEGDNKSGIMFLGILYVIIFFGIFGTVLMMISERKREFGVMVAIGMKQSKLAVIVTIEMLFLGFMGTVLGMLASVHANSHHNTKFALAFRNHHQYCTENAEKYDNIQNTKKHDATFIIAFYLLFQSRNQRFPVFYGNIFIAQQITQFGFGCQHFICIFQVDGYRSNLSLQP